MSGENKLDNAATLSDDEERFLLSDEWYQPKCFEIESSLDTEQNGVDTGNPTSATDDLSSAQSARAMVMQSQRKRPVQPGLVLQRVQQASIFSKRG